MIQKSENIHKLNVSLGNKVLFSLTFFKTCENANTCMFVQSTAEKGFTD